MHELFEVSALSVAAINQPTRYDTFSRFPWTTVVSQEEGKPIVRSRCQMTSMHLVRPHGEALVDAKHTIKMCFNPATAPSPSITRKI